MKTDPYLFIFRCVILMDNVRYSGFCMSSVFIGNGLSGIGVLLLLTGHYFVSKERQRAGFQTSAAGGLLVMAGSVLLASWSVVFLNIVWVGLSLEGLRQLGKEPVEPVGLGASLGKFLNQMLPVTFVVGMVLVFSGHSDLAAWACTAIYLIGYWLLTTRRISNPEYMLWTFLGFFLLISHLIAHQSFSVLFNETLGAIISLRALLVHLRAIPAN